MCDEYEVLRCDEDRHASAVARSVSGDCEATMAVPQVVHWLMKGSCSRRTALVVMVLR